MRPSASLRAFAPGLLCLLLFALPAGAADIKVMISAGFFSVYKELGPAFEKSTGHKLVTTRGPSVGDSPKRFRRVWPVARRPTS